MSERKSCEQKLIINLFQMNLVHVRPNGDLVRIAVFELPKPEGWDDWDESVRESYLKRNYRIVRPEEVRIESVVPQLPLSIRASVV